MGPSQEAAPMAVTRRAFVGTVALEFYGGILLVRWTGISTRP